MNLGNQPTRVRFYEHQFLRTRDLGDEQAYHLEMRRRHNLALHTWGIAYGLGLVPNGKEVRIQRGVALDGYGRELVLAQDERVLSLAPAIDPGPFDVWLEFGRTESSDGTSTSSICNGNGMQATRLLERPTVTTSHTTERVDPSPSRPGAVPPGDLDFTPERLPPDDPIRRWPVFLGRIEFIGDPNQDGSWQVDGSERRYAGIVAERIISPAVDAGMGTSANVQQTLITNGSEPGLTSHPFAVYVGPQALPDESSLRLAVDTDGTVELRGNEVTLGGDLVLRNGAALKFDSNSITASSDSPGPSQPWRIYHYFQAASLQNTNPTSSATAATADAYADELRIAMAGTPLGTNSVVIGAWSDKGTFQAFLTIQDNGDVTVNGNLHVQGDLSARLVKAPLSAVPSSGGTTPMPPDPDQAFFAELKRRFGIDDQSRGQILDALRIQEDYLARQVPQVLIAANFKLLCQTVWSMPFGRQTLGAAEPIDATQVGEFLTGIAALDRPAQIGNFLTWVFDAASPERATNLAGSFPSPSNLLAPFARALDTPRLKGLVTALMSQNRDEFLSDTGIALPNLPAGAPAADRRALQVQLQTLTVAALADPGLRGQVLAATFFDLLSGMATVADQPDGMNAVAQAFGDQLPTTATPALGDIPPAARLYRFVKYLKAQPQHAAVVRCLSVLLSAATL